jgi:CheY-like chemotaxis protein
MPNLAILVVEDDDAVCRMLGLALRGFGFTVQLASSGMQAIDIYKRESIDVVLMDVQMPDMDGPETMAALKKIDASVVCCFMSAHPGQYVSEDLLRLGSAGIIQKPFHLEELREFLVRSARNRGAAAQPDRRAFPRLTAAGDVKIACFMGRLNYGQNLAMALIDFSEAGMCLRLKTPVEVGQEVFVTLEGSCLKRPMICAGTVVWIDKSRETDYSAGVLLDRYVKYRDATRIG